MQNTDYILDTVIPPDGYFAPYIVWNPNKISQKLKLSDDFQICTAQEGHGFKTCLADYVYLQIKAMTPGNRYYFEINIIVGHLIKIGISKGTDYFEEAFSDTENGWAIYNGELRHNSNSTGQKYGTLLKNSDTVGVMFDTIEGTISFSINRKDYGIAYQDIIFTQQTFYPAVALIYKNDAFRLKTLVKED